MEHHASTFRILIDWPDETIDTSVEAMGRVFLYACVEWMWSWCPLVKIENIPYEQKKFEWFNFIVG